MECATVVTPLLLPSKMAAGDGQASYFRVVHKLKHGSRLVLGHLNFGLICALYDSQCPVAPSPFSITRFVCNFKAVVVVVVVVVVTTLSTAKLQYINFGE